MYLKPEAISINRQIHTFHAEGTNILSCIIFWVSVQASPLFCFHLFLLLLFVMLYITHSNQEWKQVFATK